MKVIVALILNECFRNITFLISGLLKLAKNYIHVYSCSSLRCYIYTFAAKIITHTHTLQTHTHTQEKHNTPIFLTLRLLYLKEKNHWPFFHSTQCSTTGVTKAVVYIILCGMVHIKEPLLVIEKSSPCSGRSGFLLAQSDLLPLFRHHITINKMC